MWTPEALSTELETSYGMLGEYSAKLALVEVQLYDAQAELTRVREWHRLNDDPSALGKNEAQRTAALADKCKGEAATVAELEKQRMGFRAFADSTRLRIEHLRAQLRILELQAGFRAAA